MNCQNCNAPVIVALERCEHCGAKLLHRRSYFGGEKAQDFELTTEENPIELTDPVEAADDPEWQFPAQTTAATVQVKPEPALRELKFGGFFRRLSAFSLDTTIISLFMSLMSSLAFLAYRVGLSAYGRTINESTVAPLVALLIVGWLVLTTTYFVHFHANGGQTPGKSFLKLRVVSENQAPVSYRQAFIRWVGFMGLTPFVLGVLWILLDREKRGWHDYLARTWVIRES